MLLGIPGDNTYANYQEANRAFWRQSVLPLGARIGAALTHWLAPAFGDVRLEIDTDRIEALAADRAALWERVTGATFLTTNEKREMLGFGPLTGGGGLGAPERRLPASRKYSPDQPRVPAGEPAGGQWTSDTPQNSSDDRSSEVQVAGLVIRICVAGSRSLSVDQWGNNTYWVEYQCAGGQTVERRGMGHKIKGIILDPYQ